MKLSSFLAFVFLLVGFGSQVRSEEGGVISGGPNAVPTEPTNPGKLPPGSGGVFFPIKDPTKTETSLPAKTKPWVLHISEDEFDFLAIRSIIAKKEQIFVNPEVGSIMTHMVDIQNRRITGINDHQIPIELQQVPADSSGATP